MLSLLWFTCLGDRAFCLAFSRYSRISPNPTFPSRSSCTDPPSLLSFLFYSSFVVTCLQLYKATPWNRAHAITLIPPIPLVPRNMSFTLTSSSKFNVPRKKPCHSVVFPVLSYSFHHGRRSNAVVQMFILWLLDSHCSHRYPKVQSCSSPYTLLPILDDPRSEDYVSKWRGNLDEIRVHSFIDPFHWLLPLPAAKRRRRGRKSWSESGTSSCHMNYLLTYYFTLAGPIPHSWKQYASSPPNHSTTTNGTMHLSVHCFWVGMLPVTWGMGDIIASSKILWVECWSRPLSRKLALSNLMFCTKYYINIDHFSLLRRYLPLIFGWDSFKKIDFFALKQDYRLMVPEVRLKSVLWGASRRLGDEQRTSQYTWCAWIILELLVPSFTPRNAGPCNEIIV